TICIGHTDDFLFRSFFFLSSVPTSYPWPFFHLLRLFSPTSTLFPYTTLFRSFLIRRSLLNGKCETEARSTCRETSNNSYRVRSLSSSNAVPITIEREYSLRLHCRVRARQTRAFTNDSPCVRPCSGRPSRRYRR